MRGPWGTGAGQEKMTVKMKEGLMWPWEPLKALKPGGGMSG